MQIYLVSKKSNELLLSYATEANEEDYSFLSGLTSRSVYAPNNTTEKLMFHLASFINDEGEADVNANEIVFSNHDLLFLTTSISMRLTQLTAEMQLDNAAEYRKRREVTPHRLQKPYRISTHIEIAYLSRLLSVVVPLIGKGETLLITDLYRPKEVILEEVSSADRDAMLLKSLSLLYILKDLCTNYTDGGEQLLKLERFFVSTPAKECVEWYRNYVVTQLKK